MNDIEYLHTVHVIKLQQAARMAGLRWKSGTPGYDKAGIIEKLSAHPSIMRATIATLQRMERGDKTPAPMPPVNPGNFADDINDESEGEYKGRNNMDLDAQGMERNIPPVPVPAPVGGSLIDQSAVIELIRRALDPRDKTIAGVQSEQRTQARHLENLDTTLDGIVKAVIALQDRKPVQINIGEVKLPPISGQHHSFIRMVKWLSLKKHILLVGPASSGKTTAAIEFAKLKGLEVYAQPLTMDSFGVVGYTSPDGTQVKTEFTKAWILGGVFLWDELSMSAPEAVGTLNSALANGFISIPGVGTVRAHPDFYCIAGDNSDTGASLKYGARTRLDGATLDRFIRMQWDIDATIEEKISNGNASWLACVRAIRAEIDKRDIAHVGATMRAVSMGSEALAAGCFTRLEILEDTCKKGDLIEQWQYFVNLPAVQNFLKGN